MLVFQTQQEKRVFEVLEKPLLDLHYEMVKVKISKVDFLELTIDGVDYKPITIEDCIKASKCVSSFFIEHNSESDQYRLEVSSPGVERQLTRFKDVEHFVGKDVKVRFLTDVNEAKNLKGKIIDAKNGKFLLGVQGSPEVLEVNFERATDISIINEIVFNKNHKTRGGDGRRK